MSTSPMGATSPSKTSRQPCLPPRRRLCTSSSGGPTRRWRRRPLKLHFGVLLEELDGLPSSAFVAKALTGAKLVKGFNHLVAATLAADPIVEGGTGLSFCRATTRTRPLPWRPWSNNSVRTRQAGKAQRGWRAGARTRPHLEPAHLPGFTQEGEVIDLRPCDLAREVRSQNVGHLCAQ
jgi:hypothetical protein